VGSVERGNFLMQVLDRPYPSLRVTAAYLDNLTKVLNKRSERTRLGQVILGLGAGRCGSTTLAGILHTIEGAVSTHENPPFMDWEPLPLEVQFHLRRFKIFSGYVPLVADCAHWWINALDHIFNTFSRQQGNRCLSRYGGLRSILDEGIAGRCQSFRAFAQPDMATRSVGPVLSALRTASRGSAESDADERASRPALYLRSTTSR
jgi:hypothetical protein